MVVLIEVPPHRRNAADWRLSHNLQGCQLDIGPDGEFEYRCKSCHRNAAVRGALRGAQAHPRSLPTGRDQTVILDPICCVHCLVVVRYT